MNDKVKTARRKAAGNAQVFRWRLMSVLLVLSAPSLNYLIVAASAAEPAAQTMPVADPLFKEPYIDIDEMRDAPTRHRYVHGGFQGTDLHFSFYFPPKDQYQGRFFQYITPVPDSENLSQGAKGEEDRIGFAIASGAYFVETNGGGPSAMGMPGTSDPTIGGYRANAAAAQYSRVVAEQYYGNARPYGYAFGGSGGAFRTIGGLENTTGVWDGAVPFVVGSPMAIPNLFSVRMHAMRILKDKFPQIVDALDAGGSGDIYAGLNDEERAALREVTRMGFPPQSWFAYKTMGVHAFTVLYPGIVQADPQYFTDFWTVPGYLGANPPDSLVKARLQFHTAIKRVITARDAQAMGLAINRLAGQAHGTADKAWQSVNEAAAQIPVAFQLEGTPPKVDFMGGDLVIQSGDASGKSIPLRELQGDIALVGAADPKWLSLIKPGAEAQLDNSNFLAAQTYHRHQVPGPDYYVWDQFRAADGKPIYPQRPLLLGPIFAANAGGTVQSGKFQGKMILLENLWDREAFPWQADWYRTKVKENLGDQFDDHFRLWFTDRALHGDMSQQEDPTRTISYIGVLQQALRDLAAWVENGKAPPASTTYVVHDGQIVVPPTATERKGIQPVVALLADGQSRVQVHVSQAVKFAAHIELPPDTGRLVAADWDLDGSGAFAEKAKLSAAGTASQLTLTHKFNKPGTYFVTVRVASQRDGDAHTPFTRIQNLARAKVIVKVVRALH